MTRCPSFVLRAVAGNVLVFSGGYFIGVLAALMLSSSKHERGYFDIIRKRKVTR